MPETYVHGYLAAENERLRDQAGALAGLLHADTSYPAGSLVLEAGCGVGAQTVTLARRSPAARFLCIDLSAASAAQAAAAAAGTGAGNVTVAAADVLGLPLRPQSVDHIFICFLLEHLRQPVEALAGLGGLLRPGGTITVIEGDHGSAYFHPQSEAAQAAIACLVRLQRAAGGDALIGRRLYPLLRAAGFGSVQVSPRMVYVDGSMPGLAEEFTRRTFTAMIEGARQPALAAGLIDAASFDAGIAGLHRAAEPGGVFCYTFFKATAVAGGG